MNWLLEEGTNAIFNSAEWTRVLASYTSTPPPPRAARKENILLHNEELLIFFIVITDGASLAPTSKSRIKFLLNVSWFTWSRSFFPCGYFWVSNSHLGVSLRCKLRERALCQISITFDTANAASSYSADFLWTWKNIRSRKHPHSAFARRWNPGSSSVPFHISQTSISCLCNYYVYQICQKFAVNSLK